MEFNAEYYKQEIGAPMGQIQVPEHANNFMARKIDPEVMMKACKHGNGTFPIKFFKRFLDDIIMFWCGSVESLHNFMKDINTINPSIQFTLAHTTLTSAMNILEPACTCERITTLPFLDTSLSIQDGKVQADLYRKPTD